MTFSGHEKDKVNTLKMSEGKDGQDYEDVKIPVGLERRIMGEIFKGWLNL